MKRITFLFFTLLVTSCTMEPTVKRLDNSSISINELEIKINQLMEEAKVTGLAMAIFNEHEIAYQNAFGYANLENKSSLKTNQLFYGASLSKSVFGYLVAQLVEEGILDLDKPLQQYLDQPLPEIPFAKDWRGFANLKEDKRYEQISARMCLNHSTGFPNWRWLSKEGEFTPEGKIHFLFDPGTRYNYSGEGMNLLQFVIEQITGVGLEQLAQERIFKPLQMQNTSYVWQEKFENNYCNGHNKKQEVLPKDTEDEAGAAGSMETSLEDYALFMQTVLQQAKQDKPLIQQLFKPSIRIRSKMQFGPKAWEDGPQNDKIALGYGMGWGILNTPHGYGAFKEGHGEGFQHYSILFPEKGIGVLLLSNSDNAESIFKELLEISIADTYTPWEWENYIPYNNF